MYYQKKKKNSTIPNEWFFFNPEVESNFIDVRKISKKTGVIFFNDSLSIHEFCIGIRPYVELCQKSKIKFIIPNSIFWANRYKAFGIIVSLNKKLKTFSTKNKSYKKYLIVSKVHNFKEAFIAKKFVDIVFLSPLFKTSSYPRKKPLTNYIFISLCFFFKEKVIFGLGGINNINLESIPNKYVHGIGSISFLKKKYGYIQS